MKVCKHLFYILFSCFKIFFIIWKHLKLQFHFYSQNTCFTGLQSLKMLELLQWWPVPNIRNWSTRVSSSGNAGETRRYKSTLKFITFVINNPPKNLIKSSSLILMMNGLDWRYYTFFIINPPKNIFKNSPPWF